jgi:hypothetical protein
MSQTLATIRSRVSQIIQDPTNLVFDSSALDGCIRSALNDFANAKGAEQRLEGLDGAGSTDFSDIEAEMIAVGASAYAVLGRVIKRSESFNFKQAIPKETRLWGETRLNDFHAMLDQVRRGTFRKAVVTPWPALGWSMDAWDPNSAGQP